MRGGERETKGKGEKETDRERDESQGGVELGKGKIEGERYEEERTNWPIGYSGSWVMVQMWSRCSGFLWTCFFSASPVFSSSNLVSSGLSLFSFLVLSHCLCFVFVSFGLIRFSLLFSFF